MDLAHSAAAQLLCLMAGRQQDHIAREGQSKFHLEGAVCI